MLKPPPPPLYWLHVTFGYFRNYKAHKKETHFERVEAVKTITDKGVATKRISNLFWPKENADVLKLEIVNLLKIVIKNIL